jgi:hypothetical protein
MEESLPLLDWMSSMLIEDYSLREFFRVGVPLENRDLLEEIEKDAGCAETSDTSP